MKLNTLSPEFGSKRPRKRVGRGIGSGLGKTCGKGHKGQMSRAGGFKVGFEGGQMPIQRRLPKMGFKSKTARYNDEVTLSELQIINEEMIDINTLKNYGLINKSIKKVKVIQSGELTKAIKIKGLFVTKGAKLSIEKSGGTIED